MNPKHIYPVPEGREALAPYNFVPLPERIVPAEPLPDQDRYHTDRFTGCIECRLTTASPLFVRCGLTPEQLVAGLEAKQLPDFFFTESADAPVIPGSSLRGMLRALVEIVTYSKVDRVTNRPRLFYRAVAAPADDPLQEPYRNQQGIVKAGYLTRQGRGWAIIPATPINNLTFIKIRETHVPASVSLVRMNDPRYRLQRIPVSFTHRQLPPNPNHRRASAGRTVIDQLGRPGIYPFAGLLVTSGNMLETGQGGQTPRKNHVVIPAPGTSLLPIDEQAVEDYRCGLTDFIVEQLGPDGVLTDGGPVFYIAPVPGGAVTAFGHSPNFRMPFRFPTSTRAATLRDFVPEQVRREDQVDMAEALFGFVRQPRHNGAAQALGGRVFVSDAALEPGQTDLWLSEAPVTPYVLGSPKPTTFQHYLVQPTHTQRNLKHYGSAPDDETAIRGHKLYWHKDAEPSIVMPPDLREQVSETQITSIRPVRAEVCFRFSITVENLSQPELGALLWVLRLGGDPASRLTLGMGKPLGMGAVGLDYELFESERRNRYTSLFEEDGWTLATRPSPNTEQEHALAAFESYVLEHSRERARGYTALRETLRIRCLLALLSWPGPAVERTRYLEIEHGAAQDNEYNERRVLPLPVQVAGMAFNDIDRRDIPPEPPAVGAIFTGKISRLDSTAAVIEVPGFSSKQTLAVMTTREADLRRYRVGNTARVEVIERIEQSAGLVVLTVRPAPKAQREI